MSMFPRFTSGGDFAPLFALLDDYDTHRSTRGTGQGLTQSIRSFAPKFDVKETKEAYHLEGELPGVPQEDINIEFTDSNTLVIKGHVARESQHGSGQPGRIEGEVHDSEKSQPHKVTVEDEKEGKEAQNGGETAMQTTGSKAATKHQHQQHQHKYWVSERSYGEFNRTFSFPSRVDHDAVEASMKNGILTIVVPKASAPTAKKINIK